MVNYLDLSELPMWVTGFEHNGTKFTTLPYPTAASKVTGGKGSCLANSVWDLSHEIHTEEEFSSLRRELLKVTGGRENIPGVLLLPMEGVAKEKDAVLSSDKQTLVQKVWAMYTSGQVCNFMVLGGIGWNLLVLDGNQLIGRRGLDWVVGGIEHLTVL